MVKGSFIAFADGFGVARGTAGAFFMAAAGGWDGADFAGVCAFAAAGVSMAAAKRITDALEQIVRLMFRMLMPPYKIESGYYVRRDSDATAKMRSI
jgi:hypothetical protein